MTEQLTELADEVARVLERVDGLVYDALRAQLRETADGARELERELAKVRRALSKAEAVLRALAG